MMSLRWRMAAWFTLSLLAILGGFIVITRLHLEHELRIEKWEREHPSHPDWFLHGSYSQAEVDDITDELMHLCLLYAIPVAGLAVGIGYFLATRSLKPLATLHREMQAIGAGNLSHRVHLDKADREFHGIEISINALLERLEGAFRQLSEYSAQVAHELRTPLTLLRLQIEEASGRIEPALAETLQDEIARLADYVDQSLLLATADQGRLQLTCQHLSIPAVLRDLLESYELWARSLGRSVRLTTREDVLANTDPRYLRQVLHILLTNAIRHGTGTIHVHLARPEDTVTCRIDNTVAEGRRTDPGTRLGLRVANAITTALGCRLETCVSGDQFTATLTWPAPEQPLPTSRPPAQATS